MKQKVLTICREAPWTERYIIDSYNFLLSMCGKHLSLKNNLHKKHKTNEGHKVRLTTLSWLCRRELTNKMHVTSWGFGYHTNSKERASKQIFSRIRQYCHHCTADIWCGLWAIFVNSCGISLISTFTFWAPIYAIYVLHVFYLDLWTLAICLIFTF